MFCLKPTYLVLVLGLLILPLALSGQTVSADQFDAGQPVLLDSSQHRLNFYDFALNPAGLFDDEQRKSLQIRQYADYTSGAYQLPFDAEESMDQHYFVRSVQPLTENDIFKGYFAYHRKNDQEIMFVDQSENLGKNQYVFADSSTGDFTLNGLYWGAEWAHRFNQNWQSGAMFYYNVDQRLKDVFPKPLNKHRNISFRYGLQFQSKSWTAGISYAYFDDQEKIEISKYNLDQDLTPVMLKFRFSDLPVIERGKTSEEREISNFGHQIGFQFKKEFKASTILASYSRLSRDVDIVDGGSQNVSQGSYKIINELVQTQIVHRFKNLDARISYAFQNNTFKARHPDFDLITWQAPDQSHRIQSSLKMHYWRKLPLFLDAGYSWNSENRVDRMTDNYWRFQNNRIFGKVGFAYKFFERLEAAGWYGLQQAASLNSKRSNNAYSEYYTYLFNDPYKYYTQNTLLNAIGLKLVYRYGPMLNVEVFLNYNNLQAEDTHRNQLLFGLHADIFIF